ncbi:Cytochrome P450 2J5 [Orchesella cincta]|uniref:Cytochrome P450 2J5 n=1 Tax=Orchesella cincta TaxID=48709 RepID=A0A1D2M928_ORCCI|nr:Cytochrome P450 2J5 [Orchesella cincta]
MPVECVEETHSVELRYIQLKLVGLKINTFILNFSSKAILTGITVLLVLIWFTKKKRNSRYPPGPISLPLVGNALQLGSDPSRVLQKWAAEYGPIYSIRMGTEDTIVLNDPKLVKELFSNPNSTGRAPDPILHILGRGSGIIISQGHIWESQRRFTLRKLRDVGVLKSSIDGFLMEEVTTMINFFMRNVGIPLSGTGLFNGPIVNALWRIVAGETNDWTLPDKPEILKSAERLMESLNQTVKSGLFFAPPLRHIAPGDFIDHFLVEMRETQDPTSTFYLEKRTKNLLATVGDLFLAGSETSSYTLTFAILYLSQNMETQRKAQLEMDRVVGSSRQISLADRASLPYNEAIILETLRLSSVAPLGVPHRLLTDIEFHGFFLPKGVSVISNLYTIHHDPKIWGEDVNEFRPERFLNEDESEVVCHEALVAFSAGRRVCLGESLARDSLFLFIASILQKFNILPDPDCPIANMETMSGIVVEPMPFKFVLKLRE